MNFIAQLQFKLIYSDKENSFCYKKFNRNLYLFTMNWLICLVGRVFTNSLGDLGSIPGQVIPRTFKMELDTSLLNTQQYKVCIKGKVEQPRQV